MLPITLATSRFLQDERLKNGRNKRRSFSQELETAQGELIEPADDHIEMKSQIGGQNVTIKIKIESIAMDDSYVPPQSNLTISDMQVLSDLQEKKPYGQKGPNCQDSYKKAYMHNRSLLPYIEKYKKVRSSI